MSDLISREALLEEMNAYKFDTVNDVARITEHKVKAHMFELVENAPTDFDLENVISEIEKRIKEYGNIKAYDVFQSMYFRGILKGYFESLEILKSAANATNGKNGG